jgi:hypothetical protein
MSAEARPMHAAIIGMRECANACSLVSSLPRLWRCMPEAPSVGFTYTNS